MLLTELIAGSAMIGRADRPVAPASPRTLTITGAPDDTSGLAARVRASMDTAIAAVQQFWGTDWPERIRVQLTATGAEFAAAAGVPVSADTAAVTVAAVVDPSRGHVAGQRIVLAPGAARLSAGALQIVLTHELFHYATRAATALDAPRWLTEGVADYVARPATPVPDAAVLRLPTDADLDGPDRAGAYDRAWWFARFVAERYGPQRLRALYRDACGVDHTGVDRAVRRTLGAGLPVVLAAWRQWGGQPAGAANPTRPPR